MKADLVIRKLVEAADPEKKFSWDSRLEVKKMMIYKILKIDPNKEVSL